MTRQDAVDNLSNAIVTAIDRDRVIQDALAAFQRIGARVVHIKLSLRVQTVEVEARKVAAQSASEGDAEFLRGLRIVPDVIGEG
jgi:hypothetical protein